MADGGVGTVTGVLRGRAPVRSTTATGTADGGSSTRSEGQRGELRMAWRARGRGLAWGGTERSGSNL
jgi:hypothetical protein